MALIAFDDALRVWELKIASPEFVWSAFLLSFQLYSLPRLLGRPPVSKFIPQFPSLLPGFQLYYLRVQLLLLCTRIIKMETETSPNLLILKLRQVGTGQIKLETGGQL